jgi:hypothetical protein
MWRKSKTLAREPNLRAERIDMELPMQAEEITEMLPVIREEAPEAQLKLLPRRA